MIAHPEGGVHLNRRKTIIFRRRLCWERNSCCHNAANCAVAARYTGSGANNRTGIWTAD